MDNLVTYYNMDNITNASSMLGLTQATDTMMKGHFFGWFTIIIIAFVSFVTLKSKGYSTAACFTVTCWFSMFIAWLLRTMSLIDNFTLWGVVILTIASVFVLFLSGN